MDASQSRRPYDAAKRGLDVIGAAALIALSLPAQVGVAIAVAVVLGRPVLFRQERPGRDGTVFTLVKFRSMKHVDGSAGLVTDADRLTRLGRLLRSTSLDELPSLWNVIKGDMSMVGPRPLLVSYLERYTVQQARRHEVRPGVTGLAQVSGRNLLTWDDKLALDVEYVDRRSIGLDAHILWKTVLAVCCRTGIAARGHATMPEFLVARGIEKQA